MLLLKYMYSLFHRFRPWKRDLGCLNRWNTLYDLCLALGRRLVVYRVAPKTVSCVCSGLSNWLTFLWKIKWRHSKGKIWYDSKSRLDFFTKNVFFEFFFRLFKHSSGLLKSWGLICVLFGLIYRLFLQPVVLNTNWTMNHFFTGSNTF